MKLFTVPLKNIFGNLGRSLTFGTFIFFGIVVVIFANSFLMTAKSNMEDSFINSLVGHIQIRSAASKEEDMFSFKQKWENVDYLQANKIKAIEEALDKNDYGDYTKRVRHNAMLISDADKQGVMIIGLDPEKSKAYQKSFELSSGRYIDPRNSHEVLLSERQAERLKVKAGDTIGVLARTIDGYSVDSALTVVGIGSVNNLSLFGFMPAYTDLKSAQELIGFQEEASDIIVYGDKDKTDEMLANLEILFKKAGLAKYAKLSSWKNMGGFIMSVVAFYGIWFYGFIIFLMFIIGILIMNLVYMMGLERRQETGTIRAIGFSQSRSVSFFLAEILSITVVFSLLGIIVGSGLISIIGKAGISSDNPMLYYLIGREFHVKLNIIHIVSATLIIIGFTLLASLYPSYKSTSMKPAEIINEM